jgi:hypothetical protein
LHANSSRKSEGLEDEQLLLSVSRDGINIFIKRKECRTPEITEISSRELTTSSFLEGACS